MLKLATIALLASLPLVGSANAASVKDDRFLLGGLYGMKAICGIENGTRARWVGQVLLVIGMRQGWTVGQMTAIGYQEGEPVVRNWAKTRNQPKVKAARKEYCRRMLNLKQATEALF